MSNDLYDPQAPEGDMSGRSAYISKKDIKVIAIAIVLIGVALYPIWQYQVRQSEKARCTGNMKAISDALNLYAEDKEDRFPPLYRTGKGDLPGLGDTHLPYTWCDDIAPLMNKRYSFVCPAAVSGEAVTSENPSSDKSNLKTTYGMYLPYSGYPRSLVPNPDEAAVVAETSNLGAATSYDPVQMKDENGTLLPDGFVIGWDNSNTEPNSKTKFVTRLAYPGTDSGKFSKDGLSRHDSGIHIMTASGEVRTLGPEAAEFHQRKGSFTGLWAPPIVRAAH
jgi:hypothetical protein